MSAFGRLIDTYAETAEQFKVVRAREIFLRKMMSEEDPSEEPAASPVSREQDKETWEKFLSKIDKCSKYSETIDKGNISLEGPF